MAAGNKMIGIDPNGEEVVAKFDTSGAIMVSGGGGGSGSGSSFSLVQSEDLGAGTKYILKASGTTWQMIRKTYTDTSSQMSYASVKNNPSTTLATAWESRTTLTYGSVGDI